MKPDTSARAVARDKPRQLFWEKRLAGLSARSPEEDAEAGLSLPASIRGLGVLEESGAMLASMATALHLGHGPVTGQVR